MANRSKKRTTKAKVKRRKVKQKAKGRNAKKRPISTKKTTVSKTITEIDPHVDTKKAEKRGLGSLKSLTAGWRVAESLLALKRQVDAIAPGRSHDSDGTIGNSAHQSRDSDHNPWVRDGGIGVVTAMDITNDPAHNCDAGKLAKSIIDSHDPRVKYVIWNRRIASSYPVDGNTAWSWRAYGGSNPHNKHVHISVVPDKSSYNSILPWNLG